MTASMGDVHQKVRRNWRNYLFNLQKGMCAICKTPMNADRTFDHIKPKALGGQTTLDNLQLAHRLCNEKSGTAMNRKLCGIPEEQPRKCPDHESI